MVLEADQAGRRAFARAEIAGGEQRDRRGGRAEQQQEERRQRVEAHVERQVGQPERQHRRLRQRPDREERRTARPRPTSAPAGKSDATDERELAGTHEAQGADREPGRDQASTRSSECMLIRTHQLPKQRGNPVSFATESLGPRVRGDDSIHSFDAHAGLRAASGASRKSPDPRPKPRAPCPRRRRTSSCAARGSRPSASAARRAPPACRRP